MKKKTVEYGKYGYIFILPFFIVYFLFQLYPLIYTVWLSFVENYYRGLTQVGPSFVGLNNYLSVLIDTDSSYHVVEGAKFLDTMTVMSIKNTIIMWVFNFIPQILLSLLLASWFTDTTVKLKGQGAFKIIMYMPNIITASTIAVLFYSLFNNSGPFTAVLRSIGIIDESFDFMESKAGTVGLIAFMQFWMWYGNTMIVLIAGILGINPSLYEAAMVDGATSGDTFRHITLPLLKPILQYTLVTSAIGGLQMYDIPALFNVSGTGEALPAYASQTITMYIRKLGFTTKDMGKSAAASMILFVVTLAISLLFFALTRDREPKQKHAVIK
ncbi:MAG: sugar ABC transporter permease [Bacteroidales bacterium]|nr:sugar ABC transporter permease [Clostridium sp.]MCM1203717.1 sugar ABC transporter permease [Bacteroidales bacterium]